MELRNTCLFQLWVPECIDFLYSLLFLLTTGPVLFFYLFFAKCNKHQLEHIASVPISPEKYRFIRCMICLINYCIWCGGKCLIASSPEKQKAVICGVSQFYWYNSLIMTDSSYQHSILKPGAGKRLLGTSQLQHPMDCRWWFYPMFCHASHKHHHSSLSHNMLPSPKPMLYILGYF